MSAEAAGLPTGTDSGSRWLSRGSIAAGIAGKPGVSSMWVAARLGRVVGAGPPKDHCREQ